MGGRVDLCDECAARNSLGTARLGRLRCTYHGHQRARGWGVTATNELDSMSFEIPGVLWRRDPRAAEVPLVFDSPHSGSEYPEDFRFCCSLDVLRTAEDAYVDELYAAAPELGAILIGAVFPRSYLDPNRAADDL